MPVILGYNKNEQIKKMDVKLVHPVIRSTYVIIFVTKMLLRPSPLLHFSA